MNKPYVAKVGTPVALKAIDSEGDREHLANATNVYEAHKQAMTKCKGLEEVLTITINNKQVYDHVNGFTAE